ncbi:CRISPR-associated protein Cas2 [Thermoanaerobacter uzonensis DSM 18761]|uniref:CRISPR-associated endoribonuclease Cas2 n=1 Tax=Thermoanaerobacter uzonensis DSM 18761 TaxID=1123369 RepID=A0A1M5AXB7_9THEO|nr:CRISPR-associated endonuclease Cas2 [Thermoanaerobacter uzonensis]SHF34853.1 CRISPR-associated protein Cas2 [Thermoanaerobacter uzonensis DSM 18761]
MYVLIVYDVEEKRVAKVNKFLKTYLNWVQNSVFEGELTEAQLNRIILWFKGHLDLRCDSVLIYTASSEKWLSKKIIGVEKNSTDNIL